MSSIFKWRPRRARFEWTATLLVAVCAAAIAAAPALAKPTATTSGAELRTAIVARAAAHGEVAHSASTLSSCLRTSPAGCHRQRRALIRSRTKLARAERRLRRLTARTAHHGRGVHHTPTPTLPRSGVSTSGSTGGGETPRASSGEGTVSPTPGSGSGATGSGLGSEAITELETPSSAGPFEMGVVAGSALLYELPFIEKLGAHTARTEFEIGTPTSQMGAIVEAYARAGIKPLLLASFYGTLPTPAQAQSLGSWAARFGPGGSFWSGKGLPASAAVTSIEFGNETSYEYQYSDDSPSGYASRAQAYALRFAEAQAAIHAANPNVGLLAQGDPGNAPGSSWMDNMFKAVPHLGQLVAGWTVHPYGPNWRPTMDEVLSSAAADGAPSSIPLDVTEWGLSTDDGRCLDDNYGFNTCMTYQEAATTLQANLAAMRARYGSRLASFYLFQARDQKQTGSSSGREGYFGALQSDEAPKGAFTTTVQSLLAANP
jgi:hypothetical protein